MLYKLTVALFSLLILAAVGCRTGEYKFDLEIYKKMPDILKAEPTLAGEVATNPDGSVKVRFEKGTMYLTLADRKDENTRMTASTKAFELFHNLYLADPTAKKPDGTFRRDKIFFKGFVGETELYVVEWNLGEKQPNVISNRSGNYM